MPDISELQTAHDQAAEAIGTFEAEWAAVSDEWDARRRAVNDAYREADAALQAARREETQALEQIITPEGVTSGDTGEVG